MDLRKILENIYEGGASELYSHLNFKSGYIEGLKSWDKSKDDYIDMMMCEISEQLRSKILTEINEKIKYHSEKGNYDAAEAFCQASQIINKYL